MTVRNLVSPSIATKRPHAWVRMDSAGVIVQSVGVSDVTRVSVGVYDVTMSTGRVLSRRSVSVQPTGPTPSVSRLNNAASDDTTIRVELFDLGGLPVDVANEVTVHKT